MIPILLGVLFVLLLIVGGDRGAIAVMSIGGNVIVLGLTIFFLSNGTPVIPVMIAATLAISFITLLQQNGRNVKTYAAFASVLVIMTVLSICIGFIVSKTGGGGLNEIQGMQEDVQFYYTLDLDISMQQVGAGIIVLSALGAVMDTALSVTSAVYEVFVHKPNATRQDYVASGLRVGRDIIGTTANTLLFAYFGESLLLFAYLARGKYGWEVILNSKFFFQEIGMMAAGMIACLLAVPIASYAIAIALSKEAKEQ